MDRRAFLCGGAGALLVFTEPALARPCPGYGRFIGNLDLRALPDDRTMKLLSPYRYIDTAGLVWDVPAGVDLDGASIPQAFWSIVGGPWDGPYRSASVIHDWYCKTHARSWQSVHRMFYEAMLTACTSRAKAGAMFAAVWFGGPRWSSLNSFNAQLAARLGTLASEFRTATLENRIPPETPSMTTQQLQEVVARIEREDLNRAQIEALLSG